MNTEAKFSPVGNATEVAFLRFLQDADIPAHQLIKRKVGKVEFQLPFSCEKKYSIVAVRYEDPIVPENEEETMTGTVRVFVKGSPENVIMMCTS